MVWQRLLPGSTQERASMISVAVTLALMLGSLWAARAVHESRPGLIRSHGNRLGGGWIVLVILTAGFSAYALAGGVQAEPSQGGIVGVVLSRTGEPADLVDVPLALAYLLLLVGCNLGVMLAHLMHVHHYDRARVDAIMRDRTMFGVAAPTRSSLTAYTAAVLEAQIAAVDQAVHLGRAIWAAYVGGVRAALTPRLNEVWQPEEFDPIAKAPLTWTTEIGAAATRLHAAS